jgi:hypothetical protein
MSFSRHGRSIVRWVLESKAGNRLNSAPRLIGMMSLQPAIPWQVALPQSPPPLHRPGSECATVVLPAEGFAANGKQCLIRLSHPKGPPQLDAHRSASVASFGIVGLHQRTQLAPRNYLFHLFQKCRTPHLLALALKPSRHRQCPLSHCPQSPSTQCTQRHSR